MHAKAIYQVSNTFIFRRLKHLAQNVILNSNTPRLYSQWLNSVIYWLINHSTDWARTGVTSFGNSLNFMTSSILYRIVTLTIDGVASFLQLLDV